MKINTYDFALLLIGVVAATACQASTTNDHGSTGGLGGVEPGSGGSDRTGGEAPLGGLGGSASNGPLFAVMYEVYDASGDSNSYLNLLTNLDIDEVDPAKGREYGGGRAFVQTYGGKVFVGDANAPTVTRFSVDADNTLVEEDKISFANYGLTTGQFDSWNVTFIAPDKAYLMDFRDGTTIIWNPTAMTITGDIPPPDEFLREGWQFESSPGIVRDGLLFRTIDWANYDENTYIHEFLLAIYDVRTDEIVDLIEETRCPVPGNLAHMDEEQNIYFSNWVWPVESVILRDAPDTCVLRINANETEFDQDWTLRYQDVTDGHHGAMFTYLESGQALVAAFYDERTTFDGDTAPWSYVGSNNWRVWTVDLENRTGSVLEGLDFNGGAFTPARLDGRSYLLVPGGAEVSWATQLYEISDGRAEPRMKLPGWSYQIVQVR